MANMICFIGLDGSGKSTSIDYAYDELKKRGVPVKIVRAAYVITIMSFLIKIGKKLVLKKNSDPFKGCYKEYLAQMRKHSDNSFAYRVFSFLTTLEFKWQIFYYIRLNLCRGKFLLVDRYIYDNVVTYAANMGLGKEYMLSALNSKWKNAPRPEKIIYIQTPVEVCCSRKDDIPDPLYLEIRKPLYDQLTELFPIVTISGNNGKEQMLSKVLEEVEQVLNSQ